MLGVKSSFESLAGEESERNGTSTLTSRQINQIIKTSRSQKLKR
jgi:hypothetical protein